MKISRVITAVDGHTGGEAMRVVTAGVPRIPGNTMWKKMEYCQHNWDHLRTFLIHEPRGHSNMYACLLIEPTAEEADLGVVWLGQGGYDPMCGHGTIVLCTVLVETGVVEPQEPETRIVLDTPAGIVRASVSVENGLARSVTFQNVASFLYRADVDQYFFSCLTLSLFFTSCHQLFHLLHFKYFNTFRELPVYFLF